MKVLHLFLMIPMFCLSQIKYDESSRQIFYQEVFEVEGTKEALREKANAWLVKTFDNTNRGVKMNTSDNLIAKGNFDGTMRDGLGRMIPAKFGYTLEVSFKEGRYRMTINQITQKFQHPDLPVTEVKVVYPITEHNEYVSFQKNLIETMYSGLNMKAALKRLDKPSKVQKDIDRQVKHYNVVEPQIISHFKDLSSSLYNYIKSDNSEEDW